MTDDEIQEYKDILDIRKKHGKLTEVKELRLYELQQKFNKLKKSSHGK